MISALTWIPRGVAKAVPTAAEYTEEEVAAAKAAAEGTRSVHLELISVYIHMHVQYHRKSS